MPTENGIRLDDCRNGFQRLSSEMFTDCGKLPPLFVFESKVTFDFRSQETIFSDEILVTEPKLLVDGAGDISEQFLPRHEISP